MFHIALYEPEIPPNTGNIIRLCANTGHQLHLIGQLGFELDDKRMRRAGLDYHEWANVASYPDYEAFSTHLNPKRVFACSTKGQTCYSEPSYEPGDVFLFGPETRGLPDELLAKFPKQHIIRIPMLKNSRSLNLSNATAIIVYEAWRQLNFQN